MALTCIVCEIYRLIGGKSRKFYTPLVFSAPAAGDPVGIPRKRMIFIKLSHGEKNCDDMLSSFNTIPEPGEQMDIYNSDINIAHQYCTRSPATAGKANRPLLFLEHRIPMPELFTELRFSVLREFWTQEIRLPLLGGDASRLG